MAATILFCIFFVSCTKNDVSRDLVIVGQITLKTDDLVGSIPSEVWSVLTSEEKSLMLSRLIDQELIVQEIEKRKLQNDPIVMARLKSAQREILCQLFSEVLVTPRVEITNTEIKEYYRKNQASKG